MKYRCPNADCGVTLSIPSQMQGRRARCGRCNHTFHVPLLDLRRRGPRKGPAGPSAEAA